MTKILILDFDGTVTNAEDEGKGFREGYLEDLALLTGKPYEEVVALAEKFEADITKNPTQHGWVYNGSIVAPATVDPYLRLMPVARMILNHYECVTVESDRTRLLDAILFKYNYQKTGIVFKEEAKEVLTQLQGEEVYIITNSHTNPVQNKLRSLGGDHEGHPLEWLERRVYGRAKKYIVDNHFDELPESLELPGLDRPVLLRRRIYFETLKRLREEHQADWSDFLVVGDIFELDLALPLALGAHIGLVTNPFTPGYEREFVQSHPKARLIDSLNEIPEYFQSL